LCAFPVLTARWRILLGAGPATADGASPLFSSTTAENLAAQLDPTAAQGAELRTTGERSGAFSPAGILSGVTPTNDVFDQELFGPVTMVFAVGSEEEAVRLANDTPVGLGSYVFTLDAMQAQRVADQLGMGMVFIDGAHADGTELPLRRRRAVRPRPRADAASRRSSTRS
jgi:succinate-semialdehyde dehydrogenase / glutarate-semialdehyde dehydrogenase